MVLTKQFGDKDDVALAKSFLEIQERIKEWSDAFLDANSIALKVASKTAHWYYSPIYDTFGPSKFIGYKNIGLDEYRPNELDGRDTEQAIKQLNEYTILTDAHPDFSIYNNKLQDFLISQSKTQKANAKIHISDNLDIRRLMFRLNQRGEIFSYKYVMLNALVHNVQDFSKSTHEYFWEFYRERKNNNLPPDKADSAILNIDFVDFKRSEITAILDAPFNAINNCATGEPIIVKDNSEYLFNQNIIAELQGHKEELEYFVDFKLNNYFKDLGKKELTIWWVNQGKSYRKERAGDYIWAPKANEKGHTFAHWEAMTQVEPGNIIINYAKKQIVAISVAKEIAIEQENPLSGKLWEKPGWRIDLDYNDLNQPIDLNEIQPLMSSINDSIAKNRPFSSVNSVNQGYLFNFSLFGIRTIAETFSSRIPEGILELLDMNGSIKNFSEFLKARGFYFSHAMLERFILSIKTKPFVILTGNSGTGKTKIAQLFAEYLAPKKVIRKEIIPDNDEGGTYFKVGKATLKYGVTLPVDSLDYFEIPKIGEPTEILIEFDGDSEKEYFASFGYPDNREKLSSSTIRFRKKLKNYINQNFLIGDFLRLVKISYRKLRLEKVSVQTEVVRGKLNNCALVPVGANWTDKRHLLGFYNVITRQYQNSPGLDLILEANKEENRQYPFFLILDEMNLSHVERYFADFLSVMESGKCIYLHNSSAVEDNQEIPKELFLPPNLYVIGTVNVDETTYMFSPKVLDRANVIEFPTVPAINYLSENLHSEEIDKEPSFPGDRTIRDTAPADILQQMEGVKIEDARTPLFRSKISHEIGTFQNALGQIGFDFGFRVINEIVRFMYLAWEADNKPKKWNGWSNAFDVQILQKMIPKIHGSAKEIQDTLKCLYCYCFSGKTNEQLEKLGMGEFVSELYKRDVDEARYKMSAQKLRRMQKSLETQRYVSFT